MEALLQPATSSFQKAGKFSWAEGCETSCIPPPSAWKLRCKGLQDAEVHAACASTAENGKKGLKPLPIPTFLRNPTSSREQNQFWNSLC